MPKISKNASVTLSLICCVVGFLGLVFLAWYFPHLLPEAADRAASVGIMVLDYLLLVPVAVANGFLVKLLLLVRRHLVFTDKAVSCLRTISWCCFIEAGLFVVSGVLFFGIDLVLAFVAGFLGLVLRVVKNVIEEAVALKAENDFTI
jgi:hypothetical protein